MHYQWGFWQMKYVGKLVISASSVALLSACGSFDGVEDNGSKAVDAGAASRPTANGVADFPVKIGNPYKIGGKTYTPTDVIDYDEVGYASFYGRELAGKSTANGETFNPAAISAAHKTLPLPSYVEVTSLATGKTILVRVNDRGPFVSDRLIDLSEGAAQQLGITADGVSGVRVRKVNPAEQEKSVLRKGSRAAERIETPDSLLVVLRENLAKLPKPAARAVPRSSVAASTARPSAAPSGRFIREGTAAGRPAAPTTRPVPQRNGQFIREGNAASNSAAPVRSAGGYVVQLASFGSKSRADTLARKLGANVQRSPDGRLFRVRYGPYGSTAEAQAGLATAKKRGYPNARIFRQ